MSRSLFLYMISGFDYLMMYLPTFDPQRRM